MVKYMSALISIFVIDPPERLDPPTDTSLAIMRESLARGHRVFFCTLSELRLETGRPAARVRPVRFPPGQELFEAGEMEDIDLCGIDILHMRKDPPVDEAYLHATYILDQLPPKVLQVNPSRALRNQCEKLIPLYFPGLMPDSLVTRSPADLAAFLERHRRIVVKPLDDCSGRGILAISREESDPRGRFEEVTLGGLRFVQAQPFLPEIVKGDKRVLLLGGELLGWVARVPAEGEFRSNINAGGHCVPCDLNDSDRAICTRLGPWLVREGIHLAGVDIVGTKVLEVNITSPSCLREMNLLTGEALETRILDYLEASCRKD
jgi:glutathione synthase